MKRGQAGVGLVILGVVAIIAVIGLVLLFTRASAQGKVISDLSIGNSYQGSEQGISYDYPTPQSPRAPDVNVPAPTDWKTRGVETKGSRTPAFIVSGRYAHGGYASLEDLYGCNRDLQVGAKIPVPAQAFNCFAVPNKGTTDGGGVGYFPTDSAAQPRPPQSIQGKLGGDMYCYANSYGSEQQVPDSEAKTRENIVITLVDHKSGVERYPWTSIMMNGERVAVCWVSAKTFPFPQ